MLLCDVRRSSGPIVISTANCLPNYCTYWRVETRVTHRAVRRGAGRNRYPTRLRPARQLGQVPTTSVLPARQPLPTYVTYTITVLRNLKICSISTQRLICNIAHSFVFDASFSNMRFALDSVIESTPGLARAGREARRASCIVHGGCRTLTQEPQPVTWPRAVAAPCTSPRLTPAGSLHSTTSNFHLF